MKDMVKFIVELFLIIVLGIGCLHFVEYGTGKMIDEKSATTTTVENLVEESDELLSDIYEYCESEY